MEDAATAGISRSQIWQWVHRAAQLDSGETVTRGLGEQIVVEESARLLEAPGDTSNVETARELFLHSALDDEFVDFLTLPAYAEVLRTEASAAQH